MFTTWLENDLQIILREFIFFGLFPKATSTFFSKKERAPDSLIYVYIR